MTASPAVFMDDVAPRSRILPIAVLSLFVLAPKAGVLDFSALVLAVYCVPLWLTTSEPLFVADDDSLVVPILWLSLLALALAAFVFHGNVSTEIVFKPVRQLILLPLLIYVVRAAGLSLADVIAAVLCAAAVDGIVVILQYVLDATHISSNFMIMPGFDESINVPFRKPGLTAGYPVAGMLCVFGVAFGANWIRMKRSWPAAAAMVISLIAVIVTSRMALLFAGMTVVLLILPAAASKPRLAMLYGAVALAIGIGFARYSSFLHHDTIGVMFELFINMSRGEVQTGSTTALIESWSLLPERVSTLLIGNGTYNLSDTGLNVDSGFQTILFSAGLIALLIYLALMVLYFQRAYRAVRGTGFRSAVVWLFALVMISNTKTDAMFSRSFGDAWLIVVAAGCVSTMSRPSWTLSARQR